MHVQYSPCYSTGQDIPCESDKGIQELRSLSKPLKEQEESLQKEDLTHSSSTKASDKGSLHSPPQVPSYSGPVRVTEESDRLVGCPQSGLILLNWLLVSCSLVCVVMMSSSHMPCLRRSTLRAPTTSDSAFKV